MCRCCCSCNSLVVQGLPPNPVPVYMLKYASVRVESTSTSSSSAQKCSELGHTLHVIHLMVAPAISTSAHIAVVPGPVHGNSDHLPVLVHLCGGVCFRLAVKHLHGDLCAMNVHSEQFPLYGAHCSRIPRFHITDSFQSISQEVHGFLGRGCDHRASANLEDRAAYTRWLL